MAQGRTSVGLELVLNGVLVLGVELHLHDLRAVGLEPHPLAHNLGRVHQVLEDRGVHLQARPRVSAASAASAARICWHDLCHSGAVYEVR